MEIALLRHYYLYCANNKKHTPARAPICGGHSVPRAVGPKELDVWNKVLALPDTSAELAAKGAPTSVTTQVVAGINYTFMFADGSTVRVFHQVWTSTLQVTRITPATNKTAADAPAKKQLLGGHSAPRAVGPKELDVWNKVLALPETSAELAAKGAPTSVTTQVVAGIIYTFQFKDGSTAKVFHQAWTNTLQVMRITSATTKTPAGVLAKLLGGHSAPRADGTPHLMPTPTMSNPVCPKCGTVKKSGKRSCCARGGGWFKNCGDVGDMKFDHTWAEGIQACKSK